MELARDQQHKAATTGTIEASVAGQATKHLHPCVLETIEQFPPRP